VESGTDAGKWRLTELTIDPSLSWWLTIAMALYVVAMYVIGFVAQRRIQGIEDFLVAGRKLPLSLAWMTLLATWFGAGKLLTADYGVRREGLQVAALDAFGAGTGLLLAEFFFAGPIWQMKLLIVLDFFQRKSGVAVTFGKMETRSQRRFNHPSQAWF
jgi:Na+/proline symporter